MNLGDADPRVRVVIRIAIRSGCKARTNTFQDDVYDQLLYSDIDLLAQPLAKFLFSRCEIPLNKGTPQKFSPRKILVEELLVEKLAVI